MKFTKLAVALAAATLCAAQVQAQTEIHWWHSMTGANNTGVNELATRFNASQSEYKVVPVFKGSYPESMTAAIAAFRAGNPPHILQVFEVGTATMMAAKGAIVPVAKVMADAKEKFNPKEYLPTVTGYYSDPKGNLLSYPFNSSTVVFYVNRTFTDQVAGMGSGLKHNIGRGQMLSEVKANLERVRQQLQK